MSLFPPRLLVLAACIVLAAGADAFADAGEHPAATAPPAEILSGLRSDSFKQRQAAEASLAEWARNGGPAAADTVHRLFRDAADPEISARCLGVLRTLAMDEYANSGVGFLGVRLELNTVVVPLPDEKKAVGVRLLLIQPDTPAEKAGLQAGDILFQLDGHTWREGDLSEKITEVIKGYKPGDEVKARLLRAGRVIELPVVLGRRPAGADLLALSFPGAQMGGFEETLRELELAEREAFFRRWMEKKKKSD